MTFDILHPPSSLEVRDIMSQVFGFRRCCFALVVVALFAAGCGGAKAVKVEGKLVKSGQPYTLTEGGSLNLSFHSKGMTGEGMVYPARVNATDGSFVLDGPEGRGIPPGRYKITLNRTTESSDPASLVKLYQSNKQFTFINGKECEVTDESDKVTIDIGKGTITW